MWWILALIAIMIMSANALLLWSLCRVSSRMARLEEQSPGAEVFMGRPPQDMPETVPPSRCPEALSIRS
jgi:hypothetical protein